MNEKQPVEVLVEMDVATMLEKGIPDVVYDVDGLLVRQSITYLTGAPKDFKTWEAMALAICLVTGKDFGGLNVSGKHKVLFVEAENRFQIPARFERLCKGLDVDPKKALERIKFVYPPQRIVLNNPAHIEYLKKLAKDYGATWIIIDSFVRIHNMNEQDSKDMGDLAAVALIPLRDEVGCGVLMLDHIAKPLHNGRSRSVNEMIRGSWEKLAAADMALHTATLKADGDKVIELAMAPGRWPEREAPLYMKLVDTPHGGLRFEVTEAPDQPKGRKPTAFDKALGIIRAAIAANVNTTYSQAIKAVLMAGGSDRTASRAWKALKADCQLPEPPNGTSAAGARPGRELPELPPTYKGGGLAVTPDGGEA